MSMNNSFRSPKTLWHFVACGWFGLWITLAALTSSLFAQRLPFYNILDHGAKADGKTVNTAAINQAIEACNKAGGGTVFVPAGVFRTGTVVLLSNVTLHLDAGAILKGSDDLKDYVKEKDEQYGLVLARNTENIAITGRGVLDGNGTYFMDLNKKRIEPDFDGQYTRQGKSYMYGDKEMGDGPVLPKDRPGNMIVVSESRNILIRDVIIKDSPVWTIHIADSEHIFINNIQIDNGISYANNDGIHFTTSRNIYISNCDIRAGDDGIVVRGVGPKKGISENITVNNCTIQSRSSGIRIGNGDNTMRNLVFQNLVIYGSNRGIGLFTRDKGNIENVVFSNITIDTRLHTGHWWGHGEPIHISAVPGFEGVRVGEIKNIRFSEIVAKSESGILVWGLPESRIQNLSFDHIRLQILPSPLAATYGGNFDLRNTLTLEMGIFKHDIPAIYCRYVQGLKIQDFDLSWVEPLADYLSHGIECEYFEDVTIDGFKGRQGAKAPNGAAIALEHGKTVSIRNSQAIDGTDTFLLVSDVMDQRLFVNNDLSKAKTAFRPEKLSFSSSGNLLPKK